MHRLWVNPEFAESLAASKLDSYSALIDSLHVVSSATGGQTGPGVEVHCTHLPLADSELAVYFKRYVESPSSLRFLGRTSKARRETQSYDAFALPGVRCPQWVACGEDRDAIGRLRSAFIVTVAVPDALMLDQFLQTHCSDRSCPGVHATRRRLLEQLAEQVRNAHHLGFFHNDLHWRNIIVNGPVHDPLIWWIDCPRGRFRRRSLIKRHFRIKDLACLDRTALNLCTRSERLRFLAHYLQRGGPALHRLARDIETYRNRRWKVAT